MPSTEPGATFDEGDGDSFPTVPAAFGEAPSPSEQPTGLLNQRRVSVAGVVRDVQQRNGSSWFSRKPVQVASFRVDRYDAKGDRLPSVAAEIRTRDLAGHLSAGDDVLVHGRLRRGVVHARFIDNRSTSSQFGATRRWAVITVGAAVTAAVLAGVTVLIVSLVGTAKHVVGEAHHPVIPVGSSSPNPTAPVSSESLPTSPPSVSVAVSPSSSISIGPPSLSVAAPTGVAVLKVEVPPVVGQTYAVAVARLRALGLVPTRTTRPIGDQSKVRMVLSTKPGVGTAVLPGSKIDLTVGVHSEPTPTPTPTPTTPTPPTPSPSGTSTPSTGGP